MSDWLADYLAWKDENRPPWQPPTDTPTTQTTDEES